MFLNILLLNTILFIYYLFTIFAAVWPERKTRRNFFEKYAKENNFDALIPDNWYSQSRTKLTNSKVHLQNIFTYFHIFSDIYKLGRIYDYSILQKWNTRSFSGLIS